MASSANKNKKTFTNPASSARPEVFQYHDYREFLKDWITYRKKTERGFSLRNLAKTAELASGYLPMVLSGSRPLSGKATAKLAPALESPTERSFFETLVLLGTTDSQSVRLEALSRMKRFSSYKRLHPQEAEVYQYLTRWYYVAIREMSAMPDFKLEPAWIQERLRSPLSLQEIRDAIKFLTDNHYLEFAPDGSVTPPEKSMDCMAGVYRVALTEFHREMFALAAKSIETTPSHERNILGHTFAINLDRLDEAKAILDEALQKVRALSEGKTTGQSVYHLGMALFPLTRSKQS